MNKIVKFPDKPEAKERANIYIDMIYREFYSQINFLLAKTKAVELDLNIRKDELQQLKKMSLFERIFGWPY